jgi:hypothetical protein
MVHHDDGWTGWRQVLQSLDPVELDKDVEDDLSDQPVEDAAA